MTRQTRKKTPKRSQIREEPAFFSPDVAHSQRFYFDLNAAPGELTVICGGMERCTSSYAIHRQEGFPYLCLEYVADGRGTVTLAGRSSAVSAGKLFAYGPGISLDMIADTVSPLTKYFLCFAGSQGAALLRSAGVAPGRVRNVLPPYCLTNLFEEIIEAGTLGGAKRQALCAGLLRTIALKAASGTARSQHQPSHAFDTYQRCRHIIEQSYLTLHSQAEAAASAHVDPAYLCRLFKIFDHESPYRLLLRLKIHHAAMLLQQSDVAVRQAAQIVGFSDQFHFSRVFRKTLGVSPTVLRGIR